MQVLLIMLTLSCAHSHILEFGGGEIIASDNDDTYLCKLHTQLRCG